MHNLFWAKALALNAGRLTIQRGANLTGEKRNCCYRYGHMFSRDKVFLLPRSVRGGLCLCFSLIRLGIALVNERPISRPDSDNSLKILLRWWMINKWSGTLQYIRNKRMDLWEFNYIYNFDFIQYIWRKIYCFVL